MQEKLQVSKSNNAALFLFCFSLYQIGYRIKTNLKECAKVNHLPGEQIYPFNRVLLSGHNP